MPPLTRWFLKSALVYLILALIAGMLLALPDTTPLAGVFPVYFHLLTFGWLTQLIFGIALWMFPKYSPAQPRGPEWLGWTTFALLNTGLILRVIFEPLNGIAASPLTGWMLVVAALLQWLAGVAFVANTWKRIRVK
jgi:hypothetical protein